MWSHVYYCIVLIFLTRHHCQEVNSDDFELLYKVCPARNFCRSNATKILHSKKYTSCCQKCSCSFDCTLAGNCCPDVELPSDADLSQAPSCQSSGELLNANRLNEWVKKDFSNSQFLFIDHCRTNSRILSKHTKNLCENTGTSKSLIDYVPVSSLKGDKLFKNKHCAACHGFYDVVYWNLYLFDDCLSTINQTFASQAHREQSIIQTCAISAFPPSNYYAELVSCRFQTISRCNASYNIDVFDPYLESKCSSDTPAYNSYFRKIEFAQMTVTFENIFCYQCNTKKNPQESEDRCPVQNYIDTKNTFGIQRFSVLISTTAYARDKQPKHNSGDKQVCSQTEIWDPYYKICRAVHCRFGSAPVNGRCEQIGMISGLSLTLVFRIITEKQCDTASLQAHYPEVLKAFTKQITETFLTNCTFSFCDGTVNLLLSNDCFFSIGVLPRESCSFLNMLSSLEAIQGQIISVSVEHESLQSLTLKAVLYNLEIDKNAFITLIWFSDGMALCQNKMAVTFDLLEECPRIEISKLSLNESALSKDAQSLIISSKIPRSTDSEPYDRFMICVSDFLAIVANSSPHSFLNGRILGVFVILVLWVSNLHGCALYT